MSLRFAILFFVLSLAILAFKDAYAYDLRCTPINKGDDTSYIIGTPHRQFSNSYLSDKGQQVKLFIADMLQPSEMDDYLKITEGKYTITYPLKCDRV